MARLHEDRWYSLAGVLFAILFVVGVLLVSDVPSGGASTDEFADYFADSARHVRQIVGYLMVVIGGLLLLLFASHLRSLLREAEGEPGTLSNFMIICAAVFVAVLYVGSAAAAIAAAAIQFGDVPPRVAADVGRFVPQMGFTIMFVGGAFAAIGVVLSTSLIVLNAKILPSWTAWLGFSAAVFLLLSFWVIPLIAFPIWVIGLAVAMLRRRSETVAA
jgi:hypothetical protein